MDSSEMVPPPPAKTFTSSKAAALATVAIGTVVFLAIVGIVSKSLGWVLHDHIAATARARATVSISGSALGEWIIFGLLLLFLRYQGQSLPDLGFGKSSPLRGWIASAVITFLYVWVVLGSAIKGHAPLAEVSAFHLYGSLVAGLSAGIVEECFFRGFVMNQLRGAGFGSSIQVVASGLLFGVAHVGWGLVSKHPDWHAAIGAMVATGILGVFFALTYVISRRSLMPVIFGHAIMDLLIEPWLVLVTIAGTTAHPHP